jgi:hypothetical protein
MTQFEPLRLILASGSDEWRGYVEWIVTVELDSRVALQQVHHTIRSAVVVPGEELESAALAIAHHLLDSETGVGRAAVAVAAPIEQRSARAEVTRDGHASVAASMECPKMLSGGNLRGWSIEWRYRKAAGISFRPAALAVRKLILETRHESPQEIADLIVSEIEDIAGVRAVMTSQSLQPSPENAKLFVPQDQLDRQIATASK